MAVDLAQSGIGMPSGARLLRAIKRESRRACHHRAYLGLVLRSALCNRAYSAAFINLDLGYIQALFIHISF